MISHQHHFIFVHIGRTGGSSLERTYGVGVTDDPRTKITGNTDFPEKHENLDYYQECYADVFDRYFKFTIVRSPFDRLVSAWHWRHDVVGDESAGFRDFATSRPFEWSTEYFLGNGQMTFADSLARLDYIARFENLGEEITEVGRRIGIDLSDFRHVNKTDHQDYRRYYDEDLRKYVYRKYATELDYFGYEF